MTKIASVSAIAAVAVAFLGLTATTTVHGFSVTSTRTATSNKSPLFFDPASSSSATTLLATTDSTPENIYAKKKKTMKELREEGGIFTVNTPIGALNPYAVYYFFVSVALGLPWVCLCKTWQFLHWLSRGRFDPRVRITKAVALECEK